MENQNRLTKRQWELGQQLGAARRLAKLRQIEVVGLLGGYKQDTLSKIENGVREVSFIEMEQFAALYEKPLADFATLTAEEEAALREKRKRLPVHKSWRGLGSPYRGNPNPQP
jgi:transcriptional regulator with XRE-family HTH domain